MGSVVHNFFSLEKPKKMNRIDTTDSIDITWIFFSIKSKDLSIILSI